MQRRGMLRQSISANSRTCDNHPAIYKLSWPRRDAEDVGLSLRWLLALAESTLGREMIGIGSQSCHREEGHAASQKTSWGQIRTASEGSTKSSKPNILIVRLPGPKQPIDRNRHTPVPDPRPQIAGRFAPHSHVNCSVQNSHPDILRGECVQLPWWKLGNASRDLGICVSEAIIHWKGERGR